MCAVGFMCLKTLKKLINPTAILSQLIHVVVYWKTWIVHALMQGR